MLAGKRLENMLLVFLAHADAGVRHGNGHIASAVFVGRGLPQLTPDLAAGAGVFYGIAENIDQHFGKMWGIHIHIRVQNGGRLGKLQALLCGIVPKHHHAGGKIFLHIRDPVFDHGFAVFNAG